VTTFWLILAAVAGGVALYFAYVGKYESAFVAAALGAVAWILSHRAQIKKKLNEDEEEDS